MTDSFGGPVIRLDKTTHQGRMYRVQVWRFKKDDEPPYYRVFVLPSSAHKNTAFSVSKQSRKVYVGEDANQAEKAVKHWTAI